MTLAANVTFGPLETEGANKGVRGFLTTGEFKHPRAGHTERQE